jgi:hypothetical protein
MTEPRLPIDVRPRIGESVVTYIRRLARANHLRPSYLYEYLHHPQQHTGTFQPERLAELTGRPIEVIRNVLPGLAPEPTERTEGNAPGQTSINGRTLKRMREFAAIRRDANTDYSITALAARHDVPRRTVRQALAGMPPAPRKTPPHLRAIEHVRDRVDALVDQDIGALAIWRILFDEHGTIVSYNNVRNYAMTRRLENATRAHTR